MSEHAIDFKDIIEQLQDAIYITKASPVKEPGPEIVYINETYSRQTGHSDAQLIGKNSTLLQLTHTDENTSASIRQAMESQQTTQVIYNKKGKDGQDFWVELTLLPLRNDDGEVTHFAAIERDISEQKQVQQQLEAPPGKNPVTGLPTRQTLEQALSREFSLFSRSQDAYSILLVEIDHFTEITTRHGISSGDTILRGLSTLCAEIFRYYDLVAQLGPDQFCVLLRKTTHEQAMVSAVRLHKTIQEKAFHIEDGSIDLSVSIGVSDVLPGDLNYDDSLYRAETALRHAKSNGRDQVQVFRQGMGRAART